MNFNKERFANFAKYDLAINKKFYRNLSLVTIFGALGITVFGFMWRWLIWWALSKEFAALSYDTPAHIIEETWSCSGTSCFLFSFCTFMLTIFCGCWAHNLRTRQGRIIELTLPASNIEKFLWHITVVVVGGFLLLVLSVLIADGLNAVMCLCVMPDGADIPSLTTSLFNNTTVETYNDFDTIKNIFIALFISAFLSQLAFYMYGNSLKYRFNLILTYIAEIIISFILSLIIIIGVSILADATISGAYEDGGTTLEKIIEYALYGLAVIEIIIAAVLVWQTYRNYVTAQFTSRLNR